LHGITALWIFTLMKRIDLSNSTQHEGEKLKREIEDLLLAYTEEMKEDNQKLMKELKRREASNHTIITEQKEMTNHQVKTETKPIEQIEKSEKGTREEQPAYTPPLPDEEESYHYSESETARVLALANKGLTAEEIAKKLNIGTGEVEL